MSDLLVTYMEMTAPPAGAPIAPPRTDVSVAVERLGVEDYLSLYRSVGDAVQWDSRLRMPRNELEAWLSSGGSHVRVLRQAGKPVGICEFDGVGLPDVELVHFGVAPEAYGKGLGSFLLDGSLRACWAFSPSRIWLHTDTNDHPRASAVYAAAGFRPYAQRIESFED